MLRSGVCVQVLCCFFCLVGEIIHDDVSHSNLIFLFKYFSWICFHINHSHVFQCLFNPHFYFSWLKQHLASISTFAFHLLTAAVSRDINSLLAHFHGTKRSEVRGHREEVGWHPGIGTRTWAASTAAPLCPHPCSLRPQWQVLLPNVSVCLRHPVRDVIYHHQPWVENNPI